MLLQSKCRTSLQFYMSYNTKNIYETLSFRFKKFKVNENVYDLWPVI